MAKASYSDHLASVPLFASCSKKDLQRIAKAADEMVVGAGTDLTVQDSASKEAFVIVDGSATVRRNGRKIATLGPGDMVGELGLLDRGPRTATVTTDTDSTVLVLAPREFSTLMNEVPAIASKIMRTLATRVRDLDKSSYG